ncbi:hypothetical protein BTE77_34810 [Ensifer adhaerens]|nr:hypothetical protein BTE77_34810 [Ensifer adhaerens]
MLDESEDLSKTLSWTIAIITMSGPEDRERIAAAYRQARELVKNLRKKRGERGPCIVACFAQTEAYRTAEDIVCVGRILTSIQERINEGSFCDWRKLRKVVTQYVKLLPVTDPTVH